MQRSFDPAFVHNQARAIVLAKLHNSRVLLQRLNRRRKTEIATQAIASLAQLIQQAAAADSVEALMGYEGAGGKPLLPGVCHIAEGII